ncbi:MAG: MATE family efflux transporter [Rhodospirillaceae bacterium]|nr:MATE family efflux transporter [Rhodospirillaceae bacterium]
MGAAPTSPPADGEHRRVWRIAGPIILSNVSVPLLGAVDTAVVGHLDSPVYLGGVAIGTLIFNYVYWGFGFLRMGTTGLAAQALGVRDGQEVWATLHRGFVIAAVLSALVIALQVPVVGMALWLVDASVPVEALAGEYFRIRIWAAPAALANYVVLGWLIGLQRAGSALTIQVFMNGLNVVLDLVFVIGFGWDVKGVALASALSEYTAIVLGLFLCVRVLRAERAQRNAKVLWDVMRFRRLAAINGDIFIRTLFLISAFAVFTAQAAEMGDAILAVNALLLNFQMFLSHALDGFAHAASALVGGAAGARDRTAFRRSVVVSTLWAAGTALVFIVVYASAGRLVVDVLTGLQDVRHESYAYLPWLIASPLISVWSFQLDGVYIGATETRLMRNTMVLSFLGYVGALALLVPAYGNHGLWAALMFFMALRGITLAVPYPAIERRIEGGI